MSEEGEGRKLFAKGHDGSVFEFDGQMGPDEFDQMLEWCGERKASDITVQSGMKAMADIGGQIVPVTARKLNHAEVQQIAVYIYGENAPAQLKMGKDMDPSHEIKIDKRRRRYRVNITAGRIPGGDGIQITVRTLPEDPPLLDDLGIEDDIRQNTRPPQGMVLVTGPTGSGKSTLLSSVIRSLLEAPDGNEKVVEYSAPIEFTYDRIEKPSSMIFQTEIPRHLDQEGGFAAGVRNALRRKPTIIMVGESRDQETMRASVEAALTGHLLFTTLHTIGVAETIRRAVMMFDASERQGVAVDIMESMRMIVTQVLLDRVGGGKVGCREYMVFDDVARERFLDAHPDEWPRVARKLIDSGEVTGRSMSESARELCEQGHISEKQYEYIAARSKRVEEAT